MASLPEKPKKFGEEKGKPKTTKRKIVILKEEKEQSQASRDQEVPKSIAPPRNIETSDFKLVKSVFRKDDGTSFLQDLRDEITFSKMKWGSRNLPRLVCRIDSKEI